MHANNLDEWVIPSFKDDTLNAHCVAFKCKLLYWEKTSKGKELFMPPVEVAKRSILLDMNFQNMSKSA